MRMTSFTAIPSLLQYTAMNQDGGDFSKELTKNKNVFAEMLKLYDKKFNTKTRKS